MKQIETVSYWWEKIFCLSPLTGLILFDDQHEKELRVVYKSTSQQCTESL